MLTECQALVLGTLVPDDLDGRHSLGETQSSLEAVGQASIDAVLSDQTIDHHVDRVLLVTRQFGVSLQEFDDVHHLTVDPSANEALTRQIVEECLVLPLAGPNHRRQHLEAGSLRQCQHPIDDLLRGLPRQACSVRGTVLLPDARVEKT